MEYICLRCGYKYHQKQNVKNHLKKNKMCEPVLSNTSRERCMELLNFKKEEYKTKVLEFFYNQLSKMIVSKEKTIAEQEKTIIDRDKQIEEQNRKIEEQEKIITEQNRQIKEQGFDNKIVSKEEFVYLIQPRESVENCTSVYKIGRTNDLVLRFNKYSKGGKIKYVFPCKDSKDLEKQIFEKFKENFRQRHDLGREYFEGPFDKIVLEFQRCIYN